MKIATSPITAHDIERAKKIMPKKRGALNKKTIRSGKDESPLLLAAIAEIKYVDLVRVIWASLEVDHSSTYDYDVLIDGKKIDVKTKQRKDVPIRADWEASIVGYSKDTQKCQMYAFTQITYSGIDKNAYKDFTFFGHMLKEDYFSEGVQKLTKGQDYGDNGFTALADCYNRFYNELVELTDAQLARLKNTGWKIQEI